MNILKKPDQAFVPVNQPTNFPRFYLIPETSAHQDPSPASNNTAYHQSPPTRINAAQETKIQKFIRQEKEIFREVCIDTWTAIKQAGRIAVPGWQGGLSCRCLWPVHSGSRLGTLPSFPCDLPCNKAFYLPPPMGPFTSQQ